jgi:5-enolpyruvylshikimate-3-phosphate synthase
VTFRCALRKDRHPAMRRRGNVTILEEQVVSKSYPRFWRTLDEVVAASAHG